METKEVNIKNDNQRIVKKEPVSLFPRKRHGTDGFLLITVYQ